MISMFILLPSQIIFCLSAVFPDGANFLAGILVRALAASLVALDGYTLTHLAQVAAEVELDSFHAAPHAINALRCYLVGVIHLAPFLRNLDAHLVVVLHRGNASLACLTINATACHHLIHNSILLFI